MKYEVTIKGSVTKTITVEGDDILDEHDAAERAHEEFDTSCDGGGERYNQETLQTKLVVAE